MTNRITHALFSTLLLTAGAAVAQANHSLVGLTRFTATLQQTRHTGCALLASCSPAGITPIPGVFAAGGNAYDGTNNSMWVTSGQMLGRFSGPLGCNPICPPVPCPKSSLAANASGLDVVESLGELWIVDDQGFLTRATNTCAPTVISTCSLGLPPGVIPTGVAVDDGRGIVFVTVLNSGSGISQLRVSQLAAPCTSTFSITPLISCTSSSVPAQGVAVDWGNQVVYWTDGPSTYAFPYSYNPAGPSIAFGTQTCCNFIVSPNDPYTDLTLKPRVGAPAGNPCANGTCPTCPNWHSLRNAPILGNTLELGLDDAPEASFAWCLLSIGSCTGGAPIVPPLCGPLWLPGTPSPLPFQVTTGSSGCLGTATFPLALPLLPGLAGLPLASQCIVLCPTGVGGTAVSNCQSWVLLGS